MPVRMINHAHGNRFQPAWISLLYREAMFSKLENKKTFFGSQCYMTWGPKKVVISLQSFFLNHVNHNFWSSDAHGFTIDMCLITHRLLGRSCHARMIMMRFLDIYVWHIISQQVKCNQNMSIYTCFCYFTAYGSRTCVNQGMSYKIHSQKWVPPGIRLGGWCWGCQLADGTSRNP